MKSRSFFFFFLLVFSVPLQETYLELDHEARPAFAPNAKEDSVRAMRLILSLKT